MLYMKRKLQGHTFEVAAAIGVSAAAGLAGSAMASDASRSAANTQADAANRSSDMQQAQWQQTQNNLRPYMQTGTNAIPDLLQWMGYKTATNPDGSTSLVGYDPTNPLMQSFQAPTAEQAAQTPGYQFTLDNGLRAVQNSAAARGLGTSGAALRGAADYASGLANSTYNDVFSRALNTFNTNYGAAANRVNRLNSIVGSGQNAAATNGQLGAQTMNSIGDTLMSGANAAAAGRVGSANAIANGLSGAGSNALLYGMMQNNAGGGGAAGAGGGGVGFNPFGASGSYYGSNPTYGAP